MFDVVLMFGYRQASRDVTRSRGGGRVGYETNA
jgi:hypothetical protein